VLQQRVELDELALSAAVVLARLDRGIMNFGFREFSEVPLTLEGFWVGASPAMERKRSAPFLVPC
jgi:hypothetical protein